jgi:hypothetical protein
MKNFIRYIFVFASILIGQSSLHATDYIFNVTSGDWSVAANWSPVGVPGAGDDVTIPSSVTLDIPVTINNCTVSGGLIQGPNTLTINGNLIMNSGEFNNSSTITVISDFTWNLGNINAGGAMTVTGTTNIINAGGRNLSRILNLNGNCNWNEGNIWLFTGGKFNIGTGSTLSVNNTTNVGFSYQSLSNSQGEINLSGSFIKQGAGIFFINRHLINNTGSISLQGGTLQLWNKGTIDGAITSNPGTIFDFDGNPEDVMPSASNQFTQTTGSITCNGKFVKRLSAIFLNGSSNALGEVEIVDGGGLTINTPNASMSSLYMYAGTVAGNCNLTVTGNVSLNFTPGYPVSNLANQGTVSIGGNLIWTGGGFGVSPGNVSVAGLATISEDHDKALNRNLVLNGGCTWLAGNIVTLPNVTMEIASTTTLSINNSTLTQFYGGGILLLNGSLIKNGIGTCWIANISQNSIITIIQGILNLGSGSSTNQINTQSGTTLEVSGSLIQSTSGAINCANSLFKVTGGSPIFNSNANSFSEGILSGGATTFNTNNTTFSTLLLSATLQGPTNLTIIGNFAFTNGNLLNTGTINVGGSFTWAAGNNGNDPTNGAMSVAGASTITSNGLNKNLYRNFNLNGGGTWNDGGFSNTSASLGMGGNNIRFYIPPSQTLMVNMGSNNFGLNNSVSSIGYMEVAGSFIKTGTATFSFGKELYNNGGLVEVQAGTLFLGGRGEINGTFNFSPNTTFEIGSNTVQNSGTINCANALFKVTGGSPIFNSNANTFSEGILSGGATTFNATNTTFSTLSLSATLQGPTNLTVTGNFAFTNGNLLNTGTIHVGGNFTWSAGNNGNAPTNGAMTVTGASTITSNGLNKNLYRNFNLNGGGIWNDGGFSNTSASLGMGGNNIRFYIPPSQTLTVNMGSNNFGLINSISGGYIDIAGTLVKMGAVTFTCAKDLVNSGTLSINAGVFDLITAFNNTGVVKGNGTLDLGASITNTGTFAPGLSPGILTYTGLSYTNFTLDFEIQESGGTVSKDLLNITGNMTLGGTLNIQYLGGNVPSGIYDIITCTGTRTGTFAAVNYPANCNGNCSIAYTANKAQLIQGASLPLELLQFEAHSNGDDVLLNWHTTNEKDVLNFEIERSSDAHEWKTIGAKTANNLTTENAYQFTDFEVAQADQNTEKLYYRLKMNDLDEKFDYSPIVHVRLNDHSALRAGPNPATSDVTLYYTSANETARVLQVYNSDSRLILSQSVALQKGENQWPLHTADWPAGLYRVVLGDVVLVLVK